MIETISSRLRAEFCVILRSYMMKREKEFVSEGKYKEKKVLIVYLLLIIFISYTNRLYLSKNL